MPRGGLRNPPGGRPKGKRNRRPATRTSDRILTSRLEQMTAQAAVEALEMPVDRLLRRCNDTSLDERYRDQLAIAVAPYCSPRLTALALVKSPANWTDQELKQVLGMTEESLLQLGEGRDHWPAEVPSAKH